MTIGILITNFQAWAVTAATLRAALDLHRGKEDLAQVVILDDASDAPVEWIGDARVLIHRNRVNLGYVRSVNIGMGLMETDVVVVLDCDACPLTPFATEVCRQFSANPKLAALGFTQTDDARLLRPTGEPTPTLREFIIGPAFFSRMPETWRHRFVPDGRPLCIHSCCMAVRREAFQAVGGFDEDFDFLDADMDFSWRLLDHGWKTSITAAVLCFHPGGGSPQSTGRRVLRQHRNRWLLLRKHGRIRLKAFVGLLLWCRHLVETLALAVLCCTPSRARFLGKLRTRWILLRTVAREYENGDGTTSFVPARPGLKNR